MGMVVEAGEKNVTDSWEEGWICLWWVANWPRAGRPNLNFDGGSYLPGEVAAANARVPADFIAAREGGFLPPTYHNGRHRSISEVEFETARGLLRRAVELGAGLDYSF